jgi:hypothetical protein
MTISVNFKLYFFLSSFLICFIFYLIFDPKFILWSQIVPNYNLNQFTPHAIRNLLVNSLIFLIQFFININRGEAFNLLCIFFLFFTSYLLSLNIFNITRNYLFSTVFIFFPIFISFFQNGRGLIACFSVLLYYSIFLTEYRILKFLFFLSAIFLSNVSSGVFSVLLIIVFLGTYLDQVKFINKKFLFFFILLLSPIFLVYLDKNLKFYDYDIFLMLSHGLGFLFFLNFDIVFIFIVLFISIFILFSYFLIFQISALKNDLFIYFFSSVIGLFFGFTAFNCVLYVLIILFFDQLWKFLKIKKLFI